MRNELISLIRFIHAKGWSPGTGGNFSFVESDSPLRLVVTPSGVHKESVEAQDLLVVDEIGLPLDGKGRSSAEALLHVAVAKLWKAKVILHTHSVWNTLASFEPPDYKIRNLEMVKALRGMTSHEQEFTIPILENSQDMPELCERLAETHAEHPHTIGFLLKGHGLYTWGNDFAEARRHLEALEFLFEVQSRAQQAGLDLS